MIRQVLPDPRQNFGSQLPYTTENETTENFRSKILRVVAICRWVLGSGGYSHFY